LFNLFWCVFSKCQIFVIFTNRELKILISKIICWHTCSSQTSSRDSISLIWYKFNSIPLIGYKFKYLPSYIWEKNKEEKKTNERCMVQFDVANSPM
jgi:hypothetical protein